LLELGADESSDKSYQVLKKMVREMETEMAGVKRKRAEEKKEEEKQEEEKKKRKKEEIEETYKVEDIVMDISRLKQMKSDELKHQVLLWRYCKHKQFKRIPDKKDD